VSRPSGIPRRPVAACDAALALSKLGTDWLKAVDATLAALSWDETFARMSLEISRAIAKNRANHKPTDYFSLKVPKETRNYLPKLQAVKNIISDPSLFALGLDEIPNLPYFVVVKAPPTIDVVMAAKLADMPVEEFRNLNPGHQRPVITPMANRELLVPVDKAELFHSNLENNAQPLVTWQTYQLKQGEKLDTVAEKFGISLQRLQEVNGLTAGKRIQVGQMLLVPMEGDDTTTNLDETYNSAEFKAPADDYHGRVSYRVKSGDTLASIARRYKTSPELIQQWNGLRGTTLRTGQRLTIWQEARHRRHLARR